MKTFKITVLALAVCYTPIAMSETELFHAAICRAGISLSESGKRGTGLSLSTKWSPIPRELLNGRLFGKGFQVTSNNFPLLAAGIFATAAYLPKGIERAKEIYSKKKELTLANAKPVLKAAAGVCIALAGIAFSRSQA